MENKIRESLRKICETLNKHGVDYMLIGGVAVGFHGFPRATADIDFWYNPRIENFQRIINALDAYGGIDTSSLKSLVFDPKTSFVRVPQFGFRTEFLPHIPGLKSFMECKRNSIETTLDGINVSILGFDDLIKNKETVGRQIDLSDVLQLRLRKKNKE